MKFNLRILLLPTLIILASCSAVPMKGSMTRVESVPAGADVIANGVKIGVTPMEIEPSTFPASWNNWEYQASGVLILRKAGCEEYSVKVNDGILAKGIHANLNCSVVSRTEAPSKIESQPAMQVQPKGSMPSAASSGVESRLMELQNLYKKGLITEEEYKATKKRILNEL